MGKMNIYRILRYLCVWLFVFLFIPSLAAQTEEEVYNEKVVVISGYQPVLQESEKINVSPKITDTSNLSPEFNYQIHPLRIFSRRNTSSSFGWRTFYKTIQKLY